jgi:hypothetical protein
MDLLKALSEVAACRQDFAQPQGSWNKANHTHF